MCDNRRFGGQRQIRGLEVDDVENNTCDNNQDKTDAKDIARMSSGLALSGFICREFRVLSNGRHSVLH